MAAKLYKDTFDYQVLKEPLIFLQHYLAFDPICFSDFRGYKHDEESVVLCIHGFPTSNYDWSKVCGLN